MPQKLTRAERSAINKAKHAARNAGKSAGSSSNSSSSNAGRRMSHQQLENALRVEESRVGGDPCERYDELYKLLRAFEKSLKKTKGSYANWSDWDQRFMSRATYTNMKRHEACVASGRGGR